MRFATAGKTLRVGTCQLLEKFTLGYPFTIIELELHVFG